MRRGPGHAEPVLPTRVTAIVCGLALACGSSGSGDDGATEGTTAPIETSRGASSDGADSSAGAEDPSRWIVTADFQLGTLSLLDYDALVAGARDRESLLVDTIELEGFAPGPLEVEIGPDGHTALVSVSPGFFDGFVGGAIGLADVALDGTLLVVDLDTREVVAELATAHVPMGFAFTPDGALALSANFGFTGAPGSTVSIIDLDGLTIVDEIEVGGGPEQIAIDESGELAIVNVDALDGIRVFSLADPAGTLSEPLYISDDPSGVAFVPGTTLAVVATSLGPNGWAVIDVADPSMPVVVDATTSVPGFPYGVTAVPGSTDVVITLANDPETTFVRLDATSSPAAVVWMQSATLSSFPLGIAVDVASGLGLAGAIGGDAIAVVALDGSSVEPIAFPAPGPAYVAIGPPRQ